jgi:hypothetical protein
MKLDPDKMWVPATAVLGLATSLVAITTTWVLLGSKVDAHQEKIDRTEIALTKMAESISRIEVDASITRTKVEYMEKFYPPASRR